MIVILNTSRGKYKKGEEVEVLKVKSFNFEPGFLFLVKFKNNKHPMWMNPGWFDYK